MKTLVLPETPMCRVVYTRNGTQYGKIMKTPDAIDDVRIAMISCQPPVATKDIMRIEPITPLAPLRHGHPAANRMARYASAAEH